MGGVDMVLSMTTATAMTVTVTVTVALIVRTGTRGMVLAVALGGAGGRTTHYRARRSGRHRKGRKGGICRRVTHSAQPPAAQASAHASAAHHADAVGGGGRTGR